MLKLISVFLTDNLDFLILGNVAISVFWIHMKKKKVLSKVEYWQLHKTQLFIWTPTIVWSLFFNLKSINSIVYFTLFATGLIIFNALYDFHKKFDA